MKPTKKQCPHVETRWPQPVGDRVLACCLACKKLVVVEPKR